MRVCACVCVCVCVRARARVRVRGTGAASHAATPAIYQATLRYLSPQVLLLITLVGSIAVAAAYLFFNYRRNRLDLAAQIEHNLQHLLRRGRSSHLHPIMRFHSRSR